MISYFMNYEWVSQKQKHVFLLYLYYIHMFFLRWNSEMEHILYLIKEETIIYLGFCWMLIWYRYKTARVKQQTREQFEVFIFF
jgi:hypothetical protein